MASRQINGKKKWRIMRLRSVYIIMYLLVLLRTLLYMSMYDVTMYYM